MVVAIVDQLANARLIGRREGAKDFDDVIMGVEVAFKILVTAKKRHKRIAFFGGRVGEIAQKAVAFAFVFGKFQQQRMDVVDGTDHDHASAFRSPRTIVLNGETNRLLEEEGE